jgi:hypothetical protein
MIQPRWSLDQRRLVAKLNRLHRVWLQVYRAAWRLPPSYLSALQVFPSARGGCPKAHPVVTMVQALAKHIEQLVALPDGLRDTTTGYGTRAQSACMTRTACTALQLEINGPFNCLVVVKDCIIIVNGCCHIRLAARYKNEICQN